MVEAAESGLIARWGQGSGANPAISWVPTGKTPGESQRTQVGLAWGGRVSGHPQPLWPQPISVGPEGAALSYGRRWGQARREGSLSLWERSHLPLETSPDGRPAWKGASLGAKDRRHQVPGAQGGCWGLRSGTGWDGPQVWDGLVSSQPPATWPGAARSPLTRTERTAVRGLRCPGLGGKVHPATGLVSVPPQAGRAGPAGPATSPVWAWVVTLVNRDQTSFSQEPHKQLVSLCPATQTRG